MEKQKTEKKMKKIINSCVLAAIIVSVVSPVQAGYYKTVYVEDENPKTIVVKETVVEKPVVIKKEYVNNQYAANEALVALGLGAVVGGVLVHAIGHKHKKNYTHKHYIKKHKKSHKHRR